MFRWKYLCFATIFLASLHDQSNASVPLSTVKDHFNAEKSQINIGIITSKPQTKQIKQSIEEALEYTRKVLSYNYVQTKLLELYNYTSSLDCSLVKFCDKISTENITSVIVIDHLLGPEEGFNFIPWISSELGISVTSIHEAAPFSMNEQIMNVSGMFSMNPSLPELNHVLGEFAVFFHCIDITIIHSNTSVYRSHVSKLIRRIQRTKPLLTLKATPVNTSDISNVKQRLNDIQRSKTSLVVLHCNVKDAKVILQHAKSQQLFDGKREWLLTDRLIEDSSLTPWIPVGVLGMRIHATTKSSFIQDMAHDSVIFTAHAQVLNLKKGKVSKVVRLPNCYGESARRSTKPDFSREILSAITMTGKTGQIQFDKNGNRIKPDYDLFNLQLNSKNQKEWKRISRWSIDENRFVFSGVPIKLLGKKTNPSDSSFSSMVLDLHVVTALTEPFAFYGSLTEDDLKEGHVVCALGFPCKTHKTFANGSSLLVVNCCKGLVIDLLRMLENDLGFKADLHVVKDGRYGGYDPATEKWNGLIGELMRGEADMAIADLTITDSRTRVVDFTQPFFHAGLNILIKEQTNREGWLLRFLEPFSTELWLTAIATINIIFLLFWLIDRKSPCGHYRKGKDYKQRKKFHLIASLWFTWGSVFHIDECEARPRSYSCRTLSVVFSFSMLVITNTYTANLAAVLVSDRVSSVITGIQDPKLQNPPKDFTVGTVRETSMEKVFKESTDAVYSQIWKNMKKSSVNTFAEGVEKVINEELTAFVGDEPTLSHFISKQEKCNLKLAGKPFFQSGFGIAFPKNSSLTKKVSNVLILYQELDIYRKLSHRWLGGACDNKSAGQSFKEMSIDDVGGALAIVLVGVFVSLLVVGIEFYVDKFGFPFSHIWTNKPHRHFPSTRQLYKRRSVIQKTPPQSLSTGPLELSISQRRFPESMRTTSHDCVDNSENNMQCDPSNNDNFWSFTGPISVNSLDKSMSYPTSPASVRDALKRKSDDQDSGRSSL